MRQPWLEYLKAAYPKTAVSAATAAVLNDQLAGYDPDLLLAAARRHVSQSPWFPAPAELKQAARELAARQGGRPPLAVYRLEKRHWPVCPGCGERPPPDLSGCPFCVELARLLPENEARHQRWLEQNRDRLPAIEKRKQEVRELRRRLKAEG